MTQETKIGIIRLFMGEELTLQEKLTIVRKRYHEHKQQKTIARELCCNQSTVSRVLQQFLSSDGLETKKRSGRPSVVSDEVKGVVDKGSKKGVRRLHPNLQTRFWTRLGGESANAPFADSATN